VINNKIELTKEDIKRTLSDKCIFLEAKKISGSAPAAI
jgi:hypothetical protein